MVLGKFRRYARQASNFYERHRGKIKFAHAAYKTAKGAIKFAQTYNNKRKRLQSNSPTARKRARSGKTRNKSMQTAPERPIISKVGVETYSCTRLAYKPTKEIKIAKIVTEPGIIRYNQSGTEVCGQGVQLAFYYDQMWQGNTVPDAIDTIAQQLSYLGVNTIQNLVINNNTASNKFWLEESTTETRFTNENTLPAELEIYDVISKVTKVAVTNPTADWTNGLTNIQANSTASIPSNAGVYGSSPTLSKLFNITWKIVGKTKVSLQSGATHKHCFKFHPNRLVDSQYCVSYNQIKGITAGSFGVVKGLPCESTAGFAGPFNQPTTSHAKIIWVATKQFRMRQLFQYPRQLLYVNNPLPTTQTNELGFIQAEAATDDLAGIPLTNTGLVMGGPE